MSSSRPKSGCVLFCLVFFLSILIFANPAQSKIFCVPEDTDLQSALNEAAGNGQDDVIKIVQSDILGSNYVGNFIYASTESFALTIEGGCTAGCADRVVDPANTVLDGGGTGVVLALSAPDVPADFLVDGLTTQNGNVTGYDGGGLYYEGSVPKFGISRDIEESEEIASLVDNAIQGKERLWLVLSDNTSYAEPIIDYLTGRYGSRLAIRKQFLDVFILLFNLSPP